MYVPGYGYKAHIATIKKGLIRKTKSTSADIYDGDVLAPVLDGNETKVYAGKAYASRKNRILLKEHGIKDGLLHKKPKGKPGSKKFKDKAENEGGASQIILWRYFARK